MHSFFSVIILPNALDVRRGVVPALPVLSSQRYYGGGLTGTGSRQQESRGRLPVMAAAATTTVVATRQRYVTSASQRYDGTGVVPGRPVFGVTVVNSENDKHNDTYYKRKCLLRIYEDNYNTRRLLYVISVIEGGSIVR